MKKKRKSDQRTILGHHTKIQPIWSMHKHTGAKLPVYHNYNRIPNFDKKPNPHSLLFLFCSDVCHMSMTSCRSDIRCCLLEQIIAKALKSKKLKRIIRPVSAIFHHWEVRVNCASFTFYYFLS